MRVNCSTAGVFFLAALLFLWLLHGAWHWLYLGPPGLTQLLAWQVWLFCATIALMVTGAGALACRSFLRGGAIVNITGLRYEEMWNTALFFSGYGVWEWFPSEGRLKCSIMWRQMQGLSDDISESEVLRDWLERIHPDDINIMQARVQEIIEGGGDVFESEYRVRNAATSEYMWVLDKGRVLRRGSDGQALHIVGINTDISRRKTIEEELRKAKENLAEAQQVAHVGSWEWDLNTDQVTWSDELFRLFGYDPGEVANGSVNTPSIYDPGYWDPNDWYKLQMAVAGAMADGEEYELDLRVHRSDAKPCYVFVRLKPIHDENGAIAKLVGVVMDITARKEMEQKLKEINLTLEQRIEEEMAKRTRHQELFVQQSKMAAMGDMIGVIAHQWSQPLNAIGLQAQFMMYDFESHDKAYFQDASDTIMRQVEFMTQTLKSFRDFFKPTREKTVFHVGKAIEIIVDLFGVQFTKHNIHITIDAGGVDYASLHVLGLPNEFKQVVLNMLLNARDAILDFIKQHGDSAGEHFIRVVFEENAGVIRIRILDTGGGVPAEIKDQIFDYYFSTKGSAGTGIGLYISRIIIEQNMGGRILVSNWERGAEFTLQLCRAEPPTEQEEALPDFH